MFKNELIAKMLTSLLLLEEEMDILDKILLSTTDRDEYVFCSHALKEKKAAFLRKYRAWDSLFV